MSFSGLWKAHNYEYSNNPDLYRNPIWSFGHGQNRLVRLVRSFSYEGRTILLLDIYYHDGKLETNFPPDPKPAITRQIPIDEQVIEEPPQPSKPSLLN